MREGLVNLVVRDLRPPLLALGAFLPALKAEVWTGLAPGYRSSLDESIKVVPQLVNLVNAVQDVSNPEALRPEP